MGPVLLRSDSPARTVSFGRRLAPLLAAGDVAVLTGDLGAGKTCLVKGVAEGLGIEGRVTSPTFNILLAHAGRLTLNHFDLYRLEREEQLEDIDFWGTLESGGVSFIEWGDRFPGALPADRLDVSLRIDGDEERSLVAEPTGPRSAELAERWGAVCGWGDDPR